MNLQALFLPILKITLPASLVALLVMGLRLLFRKAPRSLVCALWLLLAVRLLVWQLPSSQVSMIPPSVSSGSAISNVMNLYPRTGVSPGGLDTGFAAAPKEQADAIRTEGAGPALVAAEQQAEAKEFQSTPGTPGEGVLPVLSFVWAGGVLLMLCYMAGSYFTVWKKSRLSVRKAKNIYFCDEPGTPFVFGLIRPRIYMPSDLPEEAAACVLAHEQAHIARKDPLWKLIGFLLLSLHWFNPILWASYILLGRDMEKACDERAIRGRSQAYRRSYSAALLSLSAPKGWVGACPLAFGEVGIKERVKAALQYQKPKAGLVAAMAVVSLFAAGCALTNPPETSTGAETATAPATIQPQQGHIYLYGEMHADDACLEKEMALWGAFYAAGARDLFLEYPCYAADYFNQWMRADSDDILYRLYDEIWGTQAHSPNVLEFFKSFKEKYPETVFHGTDVGHFYWSMGERYLAELEAAGQKDSEAYTRAQEIMAQGKVYYEKRSADQKNGMEYASIYRENCMAKNFIREYEKISGAMVMGIYGGAHVDLENENQWISSLAKQLSLRYGDKLHAERLFSQSWAEPVRRDRIQVGGREYEAVCYGVQDLSKSPFPYRQREFWRLENAYEDFKANPKEKEVLPYDNYPMEIEKGQVFVIDYTRDDGTIERRFYRSDGDIWHGKPTTVGFMVAE